jgi:hypothetical protein
MTCKQIGGHGVLMKLKTYIQWLLDTVDEIYESEIND